MGNKRCILRHESYEMHTACSDTCARALCRVVFFSLPLSLPPPTFFFFEEPSRTSLHVCKRRSFCKRKAATCSKQKKKVCSHSDSESYAAGQVANSVFVPLFLMIFHLPSYSNLFFFFLCLLFSSTHFFL